jgi:hypothetical protein
MDTALAATQAGVTIDTVRTWCRIGAVAAVKRAGRWIIDAASLAHRIAIGKRKARTTYRIEQGTAVKYGEERTTWTIVRTDGTPAGYGPGKDPRICDAVFYSREAAEFYTRFYENTPAGFRIDKSLPRARSMDHTPKWLLTGCTENDPQSVRLTLPTDWTPQGTWPADTTQVDVLIRWANQHAEGAAQRIQAKAEQDAIEAAEAAVREAREAQLEEARRQKGPLATPRQVDFILKLLARRERTGEGGGFFYGPTDSAGIEEMSKADASTYITSLKGDY